MDAPTGEIMKNLAASLVTALILTAPTVFGEAQNHEPRGKLLYSTYCIGCHTTQVHWREQRLATDWASLRRQVRRWLENTGIAHDNDDVDAIATYLNALYYRFPPPDAKQRT